MQKKSSGFKKLFANRNFFLLWVGQLVSQLGDRLSQMALIGLVYEKAPGSTIQIAKLLSFTIIPVFIIGPIAGAYVDRWDRRKTMFICDFTRALLVLIIPTFLFFKEGFIWIYIIIFLAFSIGRFFIPAKLSIIPEIVEKEDLLMANTLINTTGMIAAVIGFGLSGLLIELLGARSGFFLDGLSFFISGALIFMMSNKKETKLSIFKFGHEIVEVIKKSIISEIKDGFLYFFKTKSIRLTSIIIFSLSSALGAIYVVAIVFVQKQLHSATKDLGFLITFLGLGLFLGSIIYGRFGQKTSPYKIIFACLMLSGIMLVCFSIGIINYPYFAFAACLALVLGFCLSPIIIAANTIIHNVSENNMMGKMFSSLEIVIHLGFLIFMLLSSFLAEKISHGTILIAVGIFIVVLGAINLILNSKMQWLK